MPTWKLARVSSTVHYAVSRCIVTLTLIATDLWGFMGTQLGDLGDETGEGVISTAIVVMIMAFLAVGLWVAFKLIMSNATSSISTQVSQIGQ
ncbi:MAG: hypothetical protein ACP5HZ_04575 [Ferrimicrobium sp.]|uniref:hypothetical protein n=1 Tax=Ferrimicrobium sp. TaxID=2926050 RepID=UPI00260CFC30|nr:hypothetical protein [Ferrimicrobium sp.]